MDSKLAINGKSRALLEVPFHCVQPFIHADSFCNCSCVYSSIHPSIHSSIHSSIPPKMLLFPSSFLKMKDNIDSFRFRRWNQFPDPNSKESSRTDQSTMVQNNQESRRKYWVTWSFARSLALLIHLLAPHYSLFPHAPLRSFAYLLTHWRAHGKKND